MDAVAEDADATVDGVCLDDAGSRAIGPWLDDQAVDVVRVSLGGLFFQPLRQTMSRPRDRDEAGAELGCVCVVLQLRKQLDVVGFDRTKTDELPLKLMHMALLRLSARRAARI